MQGEPRQYGDAMKEEHVRSKCQGHLGKIAIAVAEEGDFERDRRDGRGKREHGKGGRPAGRVRGR